METFSRSVMETMHKNIKYLHFQSFQRPKFKSSIMDITLKNIKTYPSLSEETLAFSATLYVNGKRIALVKNEGTGGCNNYHPINFEARILLDAAWEYARKVETEFNFDQLDILLEKIIFDHQYRKECKTKTFFVIGKGIMLYVDQPYSKSLSKAIRKQFNPKEIINERYL